MRSRPSKAAGVETSRSRRAARRDRERRRGWSGPPSRLGRAEAAGTAGMIAAARSTFAGERAGATMAAVDAAEAVTNGRLLPPANTVTLLSGSMRTAISAPTRLSRSARMRPVNRPEPEMPTSAFGALATTVPSASRTTMSRMRSDVRPLASRSSWVPPSSTSWPPPKFSLIAAVSHGVAISSSIGPLDRRHQSATIASKTRPPSVPPTRASLRRRGHHERQPHPPVESAKPRGRGDRPRRRCAWTSPSACGRRILLA